MFIDVATLDGGERTIRIEFIIRFRPTSGINEPPNASMIELYTVSPVTQKIYTRDPVAIIAQKLDGKLHSTKLTTPDGLAVYIDAMKVSDVNDADPNNHAPNAKAVIAIGGVSQQVSETRPMAASLIEAAC